MLRTRFTVCLSLLAVVAGAGAAVRANLQEMPQPNEHHKNIVAGAGDWEGTITSFTPGMPEQKSPAKEKVEAIGGFWTQARFECEFMGMPYVGTGCVGYDDTKKKYVGTWIDNMSSYLAVMEGDVDAKRNLLVMHFKAPDMTGNIVSHRIETKHDADHYVSTFFVGDGEGTKNMVIEMKRKPAAKPAPVK